MTTPPRPRSPLPAQVARLERGRNGDRALDISPDCVAGRSDSLPERRESREMSKSKFAAIGAGLVVAAVLVTGAPARTPVQSGRPVIDWNRTLLSIVNTPGAQPANTQPTRNFAILHA